MRELMQALSKILRHLWGRISTAFADRLLCLRRSFSLSLYPQHQSLTSIIRCESRRAREEEERVTLASERMRRLSSLSFNDVRQRCRPQGMCDRLKGLFHRMITWPSANVVIVVSSLPAAGAPHRTPFPSQKPFVL